MSEPMTFPSEFLIRLQEAGAYMPLQTEDWKTGNRNLAPFIDFSRNERLDSGWKT